MDKHFSYRRNDDLDPARGFMIAFGVSVPFWLIVAWCLLA
jgi:hypothetical protein